MHGHRPVAEEREEERGHPDIIGEHLLLGDIDCRVQHLVKPGEADPGEVADMLCQLPVFLPSRVVAGAGQKGFRLLLPKKGPGLPGKWSGDNREAFFQDITGNDGFGAWDHPGCHPFIIFLISTRAMLGTLRPGCGSRRLPAGCNGWTTRSGSCPVSRSPLSSSDRIHRAPVRKSRA